MKTGPDPLSINHSMGEPGRRPVTTSISNMCETKEILEVPTWGHENEGSGKVLFHTSLAFLKITTKECS